MDILMLVVYVTMFVIRKLIMMSPVLVIIPNIR